MRTVSLLLMMILLAGCSKRLTGTPDVPQRAEARTPGPSGGSIVAASRLFSAPELDSLQRAGVRVETILVEPDPLTLRAGESMRLKVLKVEARDPGDATVPNAPVSIEVSAEGIRLDEDAMMALRPGIGTIRVRSLLPNSADGYAEKKVDVIIVGE
jgi:hypothetical protein